MAIWTQPIWDFLWHIWRLLYLVLSSWRFDCLYLQLVEMPLNEQQLCLLTYLAADLPNSLMPVNLLMDAYCHIFQGHSWRSEQALRWLNGIGMSSGSDTSNWPSAGLHGSDCRCLSSVFHAVLSYLEIHSVSILAVKLELHSLMWDIVRSTAKFNLNSVQCVSSKAVSLVRDDLPFLKSMLAVSSHFSDLCVFGNLYQWICCV